MNPESPQTPRDEIETRITALLMGELPPEEAAALETQIAADPQLASLHTRLGHAIALLRESRVPNPPLQLSADRRARLLATFRGIVPLPAPASLKNKPSRDWKTFIPLGLAALLMAVIGASLMFPASSSMSASARRRIELENEVAQAADTDGLGMADPAPRPTALHISTESSSRRTVVRADEASKQPELLATGSVGVSPAWESQAGAIRNFGSSTLATDKAQISGIYLPPTAPTDGLPASGSIVVPRKSEFGLAAAQPIERRFGGATSTASGGLVAPAGKDSDPQTLYSGLTTLNGGALGATTASPAQSRWRFNGIATKEGNATPATAADETRELDISKMAGVEPYRISEPLSTAGKIVLQSELKPFQAAPAPSRPAIELAEIETESRLARGEKVVERLRDAHVQTHAPQTRPVDGEWEMPIARSANKPDALNDDVVLAEKGKKDSAKPASWFRRADGGVAPATTTVVTAGSLAIEKSRERAKANAATATEGSYWDKPQAEQLAKEKSPAKEPLAALSEFSIDDFHVSRGVAERSETTEEELIIGGATTLGRASGAELGTNKAGAPSLPLSMSGRMGSGRATPKPAPTPSPAAPAETDAAGKSTPEAAGEKQAKLLFQKPIPRQEAKLAEQPALPAVMQPEPALVKAPQPGPVPQPEVRTKANAFSTFSLNVSDVSFKLASASLEKGAMPEPANVRSEEFINAFDYRDPEPAAGAPLAFTCERARSPFAQNRDLLRLSVKTAAAGRQPGRPLNLVLLLDNSGSMERADRVRIVHEALRVLAAQLQPQDVLSIITFARTPRLWADGVAGNKASEVTQRVGEIAPQGGTDIAAALDLGYQTALRHYKTGSVNRVVLLTDGAANLGDVSPAALKQKVEEHRRQGVAFDCFGVGWEGYNDDLLEQLARNGDGRYGFINTPEAAVTDFAAQLAGALRVAASDVKVQVEFNPRRVTAYRQLGYAKHQLNKEQFRDNTVDAAEIGAAESGNALYAVEVDPRGEGDLATVRVRFKVPGTGDYREHEWVVPFTAPAPPLEQGSSSLRLAACAAAFSEWLVASPHAGEVTTDRLLALLNGIPAIHGADARPAKLEWMIRQAKSLSGR